MKEVYGKEVYSERFTERRRRYMGRRRTLRFTGRRRKTRFTGRRRSCDI